MRRCMLEVKSWKIRILIRNMFVFDIADPGVEKFFVKQEAAEKGDINF